MVEEIVFYVTFTKIHHASHIVDTVGLGEEMIRKYLKYQENEERQQEQQGRLF